MISSQVEQFCIQRISAGGIINVDDMVAVEEPLEIQIAYSSKTGLIRKNIAVTMRTPGHDEELAAGFLFTENIIIDKAEILHIMHPASDDSRVLVTLKEDVTPHLGNATRNFYTTSSCGVCGKASINAIRTVSKYINTLDSILVKPDVFYVLQDRLTELQKVFSNTGGIHASALFTMDGSCILLREDVGRHNALDKVIGAALLKEELPLNQSILFLSGRASFELVQKAIMAGLKVIASVGAPSSIAVELAREAGITLIGFLRNDRFNIYSGKQRIVI